MGPPGSAGRYPDFIEQPAHRPVGGAELAGNRDDSLRFADVHAGMLSAGGDRLDLPAGAIPVPLHMRRVPQRQRTTSVLCNGPADYPLLTLMDKFIPDRW